MLAAAKLSHCALRAAAVALGNQKGENCDWRLRRENFPTKPKRAHDKRRSSLAATPHSDGRRLGYDSAAATQSHNDTNGVLRQEHERLHAGQEVVSASLSSLFLEGALVRRRSEVLQEKLHQLTPSETLRCRSRDSSFVMVSVVGQLRPSADCWKVFPPSGSNSLATDSSSPPLGLFHRVPAHAAYKRLHVTTMLPPLAVDHAEQMDTSRLGPGDSEGG